MMKDQWQKVKELYEAALLCPLNERSSFLDQKCDGDEELRREVESLLSFSDDAGSFLEKPAVGEVAELIVSNNEKLSKGFRLGFYEIISPIGEGGMGEVFLGLDTRLNRKVALKLLASQITEDKSRVSRFRQEAFATSALNHPNIVTIYEIGKWHDRDFIVTEFVDGMTLRSLLRKKKSVNWRSSQYCSANCFGSGSSARRWNCSSRHQAGEYNDSSGRSGQSSGFRDC